MIPVEHIYIHKLMLLLFSAKNKFKWLLKYKIEEFVFLNISRFSTEFFLYVG